MIINQTQKAANSVMVSKYKQPRDNSITCTTSNLIQPQRPYQPLVLLKYLLLLTVAAGFLMFPSPPVQAQTGTALVEFVDGPVDVRPPQGGWGYIQIGDTISGDSQVRLSSGGIIELSAGGRRITIHQPGTFQVDEIIDLSGTVQNYGVAGLVTGRLRRAILSDTGSGQSAAMGVRGFADIPDLEMEWMDDDSSYYLQESRELSQAGRVDEAVELLLEALEWAFEHEEADYLLEIAYLYADTGRQAQALQYLEKIDLDPHDPRYHDYFLLKTQLYIETMAFYKGLSAVEKYLETHSAASHTQAALILAAFCYHGLGDRGQARHTLLEAAAIDPSSELAQTALETAENLDRL